MSKYNVNMDRISPNSSHSMILNQVNPDSYVLECGCATGYMTKYMKERMHCDVSIIEIDPEAFEQAKQYASDWFLGDLNEDKWFKYYEFEGRFDYILFADVLEHLINPKEVLKQAKKLLNYNGKIIVSIPNICHNDIIAQMFYNHFNYTNLGLLDNTHIRFWGATEFDRMISSIGMKIENVQKVIVGTQRTEQRFQGSIDDSLLSLLKARPDGEVYQYVFTCKER